jgi:4-hydroxybenzoyl-CoA reductase subunit beta
MKNFNYFEPTEVSSAIALLQEYRGKAKILAGGTDLVPQMKRGIVAPQVLVNLSKISQLGEIKGDEKGLTIGAMVRLGTLETDAIVASYYPALQEAVRHVATRPIRNVGTIGGNVCLDTKCIYRDQSQTWKRALEPCFKLGGRRCYVVRGGRVCHASLAGDTVPVLVALGAKAKVLSPQEERLLLLEDLYTGNGIHPLTLTRNELLTEISIPFISEFTRCVYLRFSLRLAIDFPLVSTAICLEKREGIDTDIKIVLGAVAPRPLRLTRSEAGLKGKKITEISLRECSVAAANEAQEISKSGRIDFFMKRVIEHLVYQGLKRIHEPEPHFSKGNV